MSEQIAPEGRSEEQVMSSCSVYVYKPEDSCVQCSATIRELNAAGIRFQIRVVRKADKIQADELRHIASEMGVAPQMPYVVVVDDDTEDVQSWFGFQPDEIKKLKARTQA